MIPSRSGCIAASRGNAQDPLFANVVLLLGFESAANPFLDLSSNGFSGTAIGDAARTTTTPLIGSASLLLDGSGDYVSYADAAPLRLGSSNWTIELVIRMATVKSINELASKRDSSDSEWGLDYDSGNSRLRFYFWDSGGNYQGERQSTATVSLSANTNYYIRVSRNGSTFSFATGLATSGAVLTTHGTDTYSTAIGGFGCDLRLGSIDAIPARDFDGRLDEVRITKGAARTDSVVPTLPFPRS